MHWYLDVTFKEDANTTKEKQAALNQNIIGKWCLSIVKTIEICRPKLSMKKEIYDRFKTCAIFRGDFKLLEKVKNLTDEEKWNKNIHAIVVGKKIFVFDFPIQMCYK